MLSNEEPFARHSQKPNPNCKMKNLLKPTLLLLGMAVAIVSLAQNTLTGEERKKALEHFKKTQTELKKTIKGLSEEQLNFKPDEGTWSVAECVEHIAISEGNIMGIVYGSLESKPDPSLRSSVAMPDDGVLGLITSRAQKVKTREEFEPKNGFGSFDGSMEEFTAKRKANMEFVKNTEEDLRNRYFDFPFGKVDLYQVVLFTSGHTQRHTDQIKELKEHASFPKS